MRRGRVASLDRIIKLPIVWEALKHPRNKQPKTRPYHKSDLGKHYLPIGKSPSDLVLFMESVHYQKCYMFVANAKSLSDLPKPKNDLVIPCPSHQVTLRSGLQSWERIPCKVKAAVVSTQNVSGAPSSNCNKDPEGDAQVAFGNSHIIQQWLLRNPARPSNKSGFLFCLRNLRPYLLLAGFLNRLSGCTKGHIRI